MTKRNPNNIGALWSKTGAKGEYLSGYVETPEGEKIEVVAFPNQYKENERQPDYRILKKQPKEEQEDDNLEELNNLDTEE